MTYWEQRGAQLEQLADKRTRATAQKVAHLYDEALERIEQKIQKIYTTFTGNSHITEAEATRLMSVQQTKEARKELEALLERTTDQVLRQELITQLNVPAYGYRIAALEALRDQVYFEAKAIGNDSVAYTESRLKDLYDLGYYRTAFDLSQYEGSNVPFSQLSGGRVEAAINAYWTPDVDTLAGNYSTRIWADTTQLAENVRDIVTRGLMTGGNYADMAAELAAQMGDVQFRKKADADGSTRTVATGSGAKYQATRLIRTEGNYITGQAKLQSMRDAGYEKYEFICLLETRTCSVCGGLDGKQFPVEEAQPGVNMNPMHPNCRCFVSPVVSKQLTEAGTRGAQVDASGRKETVPASMTYQEWYEKYVKGNGENDGQAKRLKEPQAFSDSQIVTTERPALTPHDIRETPQEPEIEVEKGENSGIIKQSSDRDEVPDVRQVCSLDPELYQCVTNDIATDEVVITEKQIEHIKERHPDDYEICERWAETIIRDPDYIIRSEKPNTAIVLRQVEENGKKYRLILRLKTSKDPENYKNSIITFQKVKEKEWRRLLRNKETLYKRE